MKAGLLFLPKTQLSTPADGNRELYIFLYIFSIITLIPWNRVKSFVNLLES